MSSTDKDPLWVLFAHLADVERALIAIPDHAKWTESLFESDPPPAGFDFHPESNRAGLPQPEHLLEKRTRSMECAAEHFDRFQVLWDLFDGGLNATDAALQHLPACSLRLGEEEEPLLRRPSSFIARDLLAARSLFQAQPVGPRPPDAGDLAERATTIAEALGAWIDLILGAAKASPPAASATPKAPTDAIRQVQAEIKELREDLLRHGLIGIDAELNQLNDEDQRATWLTMRSIEFAHPDAPVESPGRQYEWATETARADDYPAIKRYFAGLPYEAFKKRSYRVRRALGRVHSTPRRAGI